jgi:hypothetical protein
MKTSENINELAGALAKAQAEIKNAKFDAKNPHFKSKYATLASVRDAITPALTKHGLAIAHATSLEGNGMLVVNSRLMHTSGQWIEAAWPIIGDTNKPQAMMSAYTYAKRANDAALTNIASEEDDDANEAQEHGQMDPDMRNMTGDPRAKGYKTNGTTPGAVAAQNTNAAYASLTNEIRAATSLDALKEWKRLRAKEINALPTDWIDHLAEEYERQKDELSARVPA